MSNDIVHIIFLVNISLSYIKITIDTYQFLEVSEYETNDDTKRLIRSDK